MFQRKAASVTTQTYHEASMTLLAQAEAELAQGDVRQASEKGWGAAAQIVKAAAQQRGLPHGDQPALYRVVDALSSEARDDNIYLLFQVATQLHFSFYENWDSPQNVQRALAATRRFVELVSRLI